MSDDTAKLIDDIRERRLRNTTPRGEDVEILLGEVERLEGQLDAVRQILVDYTDDDGPGASLVAIGKIGKVVL